MTIIPDPPERNVPDDGVTIPGTPPLPEPEPKPEPEPREYPEPEDDKAGDDATIPDEEEQAGD